MSKLGDYLNPLVSDECPYPDDVSRLKKEIQELVALPGSLVEKMYRDFSSERCAQWLIVDEEIIQQFREWLE